MVREKVNQERFKDLYLKGYSAIRLWQLLGRDYTNQNILAVGRMTYWRDKLNLPKRGKGFRSPISIREVAEIKIRRIDDEIIKATKSIDFAIGRIEMAKDRIKRLTRERKELTALDKGER